MSYQLSIPRSVNERTERLPTEVYEWVDSAVLALAEELRPPGCVRFKGREDWRIRVRDYRIVYNINDEQRVVEILNVAHLREIYRR